MTPKNFDKTLAAYQRRKPFRSFRVRFVSGEYLDVDHPEAMFVRGGTEIHLSAAGVPTIFDHESVSEVIGETDHRSA